MVPQARFLELLADIEPSPTTKSNASVAHRSVRDHLRTHEDFSSRWEGDFLAGSYSRDTAVRPKKTTDGHERPDVDIIIETNFSTNDHPDDVLAELREALEDEFEVQRTNKRSVRILTSNAEMDVVPVVAVGDHYELPDRDLEKWKATNPPKHDEWSSDQNKRFSSRFKPLVKMFKWWLRENKPGKRPKGFILEVLASLHAPDSEIHYGEAFAQMLEKIYDAYKVYVQLNMKPNIADPALPTNDIMSKVSMTDWKNFIEKVRVHAGYAREAQTTDDMERATVLWRRIFGDRFKATENPTRSESLSRSASAASFGAGFAFPPHNAAPTTPRGFA